jgi:glycosyltransferase involved in cell wall biosynthesis
VTEADGIGRVSVALIHYAVPPVVGGVERVLASHARLLAAAGHEVRVIAGRGSMLGPGVRFIEIPRIDSRHPEIASLHTELDAGRLPDGFSGVVAALGAEIEKALEGIDIVIAHNVCSLGLNLPLTAALRGLADLESPRLVLWHHDLAWTSAQFRSALHDGLPWDLLRTPWPRVRQVVVSAARQGELAKLMGIPASSIRVVPNGIDVGSSLRLEPRAAEILARVDRAGAALLFLAPNRATPRKNLEMALRVVAAMRAAAHNAALVVTGPVDPHRAGLDGYLDELLALRHALGLDAVVWFLAAEPGGTPSDAMVSDLYRLADALLLTSYEEGFGLPILEAGVHRLPIICSDLPVLRELAGSDALYVDPDGDPAAIAVRVAAHLEANGALRLARRIRTEYSWEAIYQTGIAPLLESSGPRPGLTAAEQASSFG